MLHLNNTTMKTILVIFTLMVPFFCSAQSELTGIVKTDKSNQPIKNCHVYINKYLGTVTDENGKFQLFIPEKYSGLDFHVSHIGYKTFKTSVNDFKNNGIIAMQQTAIMLPEIVVNPDPWITFQERIDKIIAEAKNQTDENIYNSILDELERMKPPYEAYYFKSEKENRK